MTKSYKVMLRDGSSVTIDDVARVEKDGSGLRLYGEDDTIIASFDDGQSKGCFPTSAKVDAPSVPTEESDPAKK